MGATNYQLALSKRYSKLTGQLQEIRANIARIKSEQKVLSELEASIPRFERLIASLAILLEEEDATWRPDQAPPIRPWSYKIPVPFGSTSRRGMEVLARSEHGMTARQIAIQVLTEAGNPQPTNEDILRTTNTITSSLRKFKGRTVESSGKYPAQWRVLHKQHVKFDP